MTEANIALLIDYENIGDLDSIEYLMDQLSDIGRVIIKRAYADWSAQRDKRDQLLELGIEGIHLFRSTKSGKNSSDIRLAIDAVDLLYGAPIDTFVIASSDSDFVSLVSKLRAAGKSVIGAGRREAASRTLIRSCDRYVFLDDAKPAPVRRVISDSREEQVASLVVRALEASMDGQGQVVGSKLHEAMQRIDPSFNYRALGHRTFSQFLSAQKGVTVTRPRGPGDVIVQLETSSGNGRQALDTPAPPPDWDNQLDAAWANRQRSTISGQAAAADAARVLGVPNLSASSFKTLQKLLAASEFLRARWHREGNAVIKR